MVIKDDGDSLRHRRRRTLKTSEGPTPIELTTSDPLDPHERNDIKSYATRALVPYDKDDDRPSFAGAQGAVYRATRTTTRGLLRRARVEAFAIKEIRLEDSRARERLRNEIKHLRLCDHPNILRLREAYTIEQEQWIDTTFLVTEPWAQSSLQRFLQSVATDGRSSSCPWYIPQNLDPWPSIVKQCILGVKHLHENSIKHKDLKPDNILLLDESNGDYLHPKVRPIIADLGISKEYVVGAKTTFQGTYQYLAPEQIDEDASTLESDVFSLGCCFAWIHSVLSSTPWEKDKQDEQGPSQLDELVCVGFASTAGEIPTLLERLRMDQKSPKRPETLEFLFAMEEMIARMLVATPSKRAKLESLLDRLDTYATRCRLFKKKKTVYLFLTSGRNTTVNELDVSDVSSDAEFFLLVRSRIIASYGYLRIFGLGRLQGSLGIDDVRFIKFVVQDGVFGVLEGPNSVPSTSALQAEEYEYAQNPPTELPPVPRDIFLYNLSSCSVSLHNFWFDRIPKKVQVLGHHRDGSSEFTSQSPDEKTVPENVGWGVQIIDTNNYWAASSLAWISSFMVTTGMFLVLGRYYWWIFELLTPNIPFTKEQSPFVSAAGFDYESNLRGTLDILWSCFSTIFVCAWTILHLNVPEQREGRDPGRRGDLKWKLKGFWRRAKWMIITMIAPELLLARAWSDYYCAWRYSPKLKKLAAEDDVSWTVTHTFLANMGGFVVRSREEDQISHRSKVRAIHKIGGQFDIRQTLEVRYPTSQARLEDLDVPRASAVPITSSESLKKASQDNLGHQQLKPYTFLPLGANDILKLREAGLLSRLPDVTITEIDDKSKSDTLVNAIAIIQTLWVFLQVVVRAYCQMAVSQLEISAIAFAVCAIIIYSLNWKKPQGVKVPFTLLSYENCIPAKVLEILGPQDFPFTKAEFSSSIESDFVRAGLNDFRVAKYPTTTRLEMGSQSLGLMFGALIFGGANVAAFCFVSPTTVERLPWRVPSLWLTVLILVLNLRGVFDYGFLQERVWKWPLRILAGLYILARLFFMVEIFRDLSSLPAGAYVSTWADYIPHVG